MHSLVRQRIFSRRATMFTGSWLTYAQLGDWPEARRVPLAGCASKSRQPDALAENSLRVSVRHELRLNQVTRRAHEIRFRKKRATGGQLFANVRNLPAILEKPVDNFDRVIGIVEAQAFVGHDLGRRAAGGNEGHKPHLHHLGHRDPERLAPAHVKAERMAAKLGIFVVAIEPAMQAHPSALRLHLFADATSVSQTVKRTDDVKLERMPTRPDFAPEFRWLR